MSENPLGTPEPDAITASHLDLLMLELARGYPWLQREDVAKLSGWPEQHVGERYQALQAKVSHTPICSVVRPLSEIARDMAFKCALEKELSAPVLICKKVVVASYQCHTFWDGGVFHFHFRLVSQAGEEVAATISPVSAKIPVDVQSRLELSRLSGVQVLIDCAPIINHLVVLKIS